MNLLLLLLACAGDKAPAGDGEDTAAALDCNPIAPALSCLLPYPSDVWRSEAGVAVSDAALPVYNPGGDAVPTPMNPFADHPAAGFSPVATLLAALDVPLDEAPLIGYTEDPSLSLAASSSPTLLIEADTGRAVPHFAELDAMAEAGTVRTLVIRPLERLRDGARYVVGLHGLVDTAGALAPPTAGFVSILNGDGPLAARYGAEVLPVLEAAGLPAADLQLAWDFTVRPLTDATGDMLAARQIGLDLLALADPVVTLTEVVDDVDSQVSRHIEGTVRVPLLLEADAPLSPLFRDSSGAITQNGWIEVPFTVLIPAVTDRTLSAVQFGHGFFGNRTEMEGIGRSYGNNVGAVFFGIDWQGMSQPDLVPVAGAMANDMGHGLMFTDRVHQAMVNQLFLSRAISTSLTTEAALQDASGALRYDPSTLGFYGISMGHILGGVYAPLSPDIERVALGSGGASFSLMMMRALPFLSFAQIVLMGVPGSAELLQFSALSQTTFDRIDPGVYAPYLSTDPLPGSPDDRRVLIQMGIGDAQVPNVGTHLHGRSLGLPILSPTPRAVYGYEEASYPLEGSGLVEFDFGYEAPLAGDVADLGAEANEVHGAVRELPHGQAQIGVFLTGGAIESVCDGACDPD
jgi:hypothetical protein